MTLNERIEAAAISYSAGYDGQEVANVRTGFSAGARWADSCPDGNSEVALGLDRRAQSPESGAAFARGFREGVKWLKGERAAEPAGAATPPRPALFIGTVFSPEFSDEEGVELDVAVDSDLEALKRKLATSADGYNGELMGEENRLEFSWDGLDYYPTDPDVGYGEFAWARIVEVYPGGNYVRLTEYR